MSVPVAPGVAFSDVPSAKHWLSRQPQANPAQLQAALATEIGHLNRDSTIAPAMRLALLEFLREAVAYAQTECAKKFTGRALPLAPHMFLEVLIQEPIGQI